MTPRALRLLVLIGALAGAASADPGDRPHLVRFQFLPVEGAHATLSVRVLNIPGFINTFQLRVGSKVRSFTGKGSWTEGSVEVPADPRAFLRFTVQEPHDKKPLPVLALFVPGMRATLLSDPCATWELSAGGGRPWKELCVPPGKECPEGTSASWEGAETECGSAEHSYCLPDYHLEVSGEAGQKLRAELEVGEEEWIALRGPADVHRLTIPSGGRCPRFRLRSGKDWVAVVANPNQYIRVRVAADGRISAEDLPEPAH